MLVRIIEPKFTIFFDIKDITRITPIFLGANIDSYKLELTNLSKSIQISTQQLDRLTPFLGYLDLSIDSDEQQEKNILDDDFAQTISELLDRAIKSPSI